MPRNGPSVFHGLCDVGLFDVGTLSQISNGSGNFENAVRAATTPSEMGCNLRDVSQCILLQSRVLVQGGAPQSMVAAALPLSRYQACVMASLFKHSRAFTRRRVNEQCGALAGHLDVQINAV